MHQLVCIRKFDVDFWNKSRGDQTGQRHREQPKATRNKIPVFFKHQPALCNRRCLTDPPPQRHQKFSL